MEMILVSKICQGCISNATYKIHTLFKGIRVATMYRVKKIALGTYLGKYISSLTVVASLNLKVYIIENRPKM